MRLAPGDTLGIIGGGQLGRMLALAAARLGLAVHILDPQPDAPAFAVAARHTVAAYDDSAALAALAAAVDVVTYEFENVPVAPLRAFGDKVRPGVQALEVAQDRLTEKTFLAGCGLPVAPHAAVADAADLARALAAAGGEAILKTRRLGYDGKGQVRIVPGDDPVAALAAIGSAPAILESVVPFRAETSTVLVRAADGTSLAYAMPANHHDGGILRRSCVPGPLDPAREAAAVAMTRAVAERLAYVGVLAIEWFVTDDPACPLVANEMAPRVHNTGHWTQDGAVTSQFENHVRAVAGWPLGSPARIADVVMENLIGADALGWAAHLDNPTARLHLYGKREIRPGRKMGHVNFVSRPVDLDAKGW